MLFFFQPRARLRDFLSFTAITRNLVNTNIFYRARIFLRRLRSGEKLFQNLCQVKYSIIRLSLLIWMVKTVLFHNYLNVVPLQNITQPLCDISCSFKICACCVSSKLWNVFLFHKKETKTFVVFCNKKEHVQNSIWTASV